MLTTREVIKTFYNALLQRLKKHRSDWNQNDPSADDYIKNRPFYTDENDKTVNVPEQKITIPSRRPYAVQLILPKLIEFVVGQTYEVKWDDKTYSCVAFDLNGISAIGNRVLFGDGTDTGEPFIMRISKAIGFGEVAAPEAIGTHTVEVTTTKVVTLDRKYLPNLGLAPVATSGSYGDLEDAPEIYYDVVRYDTSQSLAEDQKAQARDNIGAGTSSFDGNYNNLTNVPCKKVYSYGPYTGIWTSHLGTWTSPAGYSFLYKDNVVDDCQYDTAIVSFRGTVFATAYFTTDYTPAKIIDNLGWCYWGNASLWSEEFGDTGEEWCVRIHNEDANPGKISAYLYYAPKEISTFSRSIKTLDIIETLDEDLIPKIIQRTGDPVVLSDANGAKWRLTVGTDGALTTEAVTEQSSMDN